MKKLNKNIKLLESLINKAGTQAKLAVELTKLGKRYGFKINQAGVAQWVRRDNVSPIGIVLLEEYKNA